MDVTMALFVVLMIVYVGITIFWGLYNAKKNDTGTVEDWFVAGGKITFIGVGLTMAAAWLDMATVFLNTGGGHDVGISAFWYLAGAEMAAFFLFAVWLGKHVRRQSMISQGAMLEKRFAPIIRPLYAIIWVVSLSGYAGLSFFVFQETFMHFFGLSPIISALICLGIVLGYQLVGGFIAVVYADYIQCSLIIVGTAILGWFAVKGAGGLDVVVKTVPSNFLSPVGIGWKEIGLLLLSLVPAFLVEPTAWMRLSSARSDREASKGMGLAILVYIPVCAFTLIAGLAAYVLYPVWDKSPDLIAIQMAQDFFPPVVTAIVLVAIIAALISSFSAFMFAANLSLSYDFIPDIYKRMTGKVFPEDKYRLVSKIGLIVIGVLASYIAITMPSLLDILLFSGTIAGSGIFWPVMAMFFWKRATTQGALASFVLGSGTAILWFILGQPFGIEPIVLAFPLSFLALVIGSYATPAPTAAQLEGFYSNE